MHQTMTIAQSWCKWKMITQSFKAQFSIINFIMKNDEITMVYLELVVDYY